MLFAPRINSPKTGDVVSRSAAVDITWTPMLSLCTDLPGGDMHLCPANDLLHETYLIQAAS